MEVVKYPEARSFRERAERGLGGQLLDGPHANDTWHYFLLPARPLKGSGAHGPTWTSGMARRSPG